MNNENIKTPLDLSTWITTDAINPAPVFVKRFTLDSTDENAKLYIIGLGFFEAKLNGVKLGNEYFVPFITDYERRPLDNLTLPIKNTFTHRIYYLTYDVGSLIKKGENILEIHIGGGWFVQTEHCLEGDTTHSEKMKCIFTLISGNDVIRSDGSETWNESEITYSNLYIGEIIDFTKDLILNRPVMTLPHPDTIICPQIGTPDRHIRTLTPKKLGTVDGRDIYDIGENVSGLVRITTKDGYVGKITMRFAENLNEDGSLNFFSTGSSWPLKDGRNQIMEDNIICDGKVREVMPKFVFHAFRYFDAVGEFDKAEMYVIHADAPVTSEFTSDMEGMNFLYDAYLRTQLDNMHTSIPSDCPHRERLGYTGDGQACAPTAMLLLDSREFYLKWLRDILDCQDIHNGHVQHTAPFMGGGGGPGGWGCAMILVPYYYIKQFGDFSILDYCMEPMKKWIGYLETRLEGDLITHEEPEGWCLGDWLTLDPIKIPEPYVNTYYFVKCLGIMRTLFKLRGGDELDSHYAELEKRLSDAIVKNYIVNGHVIEGYQAADAFACDIGLLPLTAVTERYENLDHFDSGFLATDIISELFFKARRGDIFSKIVESDSLGTFLYMKRHGATTLWESWTGDMSHNHPMFGACARQLFTGILGMRQDDDSYGWNKVTVSPAIPEESSNISGSILTPHGKLSVSAERDGEKIYYTVTVPAGIKAVFKSDEYTTELNIGENKIVL